jgi:hypothetical protein
VKYIQVICILTELSEVAMAEHEGECGRGTSAKLVRGVDYAVHAKEEEKEAH